MTPPQPHICKWIDQSETYESGHYRGENWQACTENQWCKDCLTGYHEVCENIEEQLSEHFGFRVSLDEIAVYNLWNKVEDYTSLSKLEKNIKFYLPLNRGELTFLSRKCVCKKMTTEFQPLRQKNLVDGYLYVMTSSWMPTNVYKVGLTENLSARVGQYNTYHINARFILTSPRCPSDDIFCKGKNEPVKPIDLIYYREDAVHKMLKQYRCVQNREFFECELSKIKEAFEKVESMNETQLIAYLTDTDISSKPELERLREENSKLLEKVDELQQSKTNLEQVVIDLEKERDEYKLQATDIGAKIAAEKKYKALSEAFEDMKKKYENIAETESENKKIKQQFEKEKKESQEKIKDLEGLIEKMKKECSEFKKTIEDKKVKQNKVTVKEEFLLSPKKDVSLPNKNKVQELFEALLLGHYTNISNKLSLEVETLKGCEKKIIIKGHALISSSSEKEASEFVKILNQKIFNNFEAAAKVIGATLEKYD